MPLRSESNKKRVSWCAACGNGEWSGGFSLLYTGDDRVACDGGSGRETVWGIFLMVMFAIGHSVLLVTAGTSYSVVERWMYDPKYEKISKTLRTVMGVLILLIGVAMIYLAMVHEG